MINHKNRSRFAALAIFGIIGSANAETASILPEVQQTGDDVGRQIWQATVNGETVICQTPIADNQVRVFGNRGPSKLETEVILLGAPEVAGKKMRVISCTPK